jgi:hypothetical protein
MSPEEDLISLEAELARLRPRKERLDRDRLMYLAGRASVGGKAAVRGPRAWHWPAALAAMTTIAAVLAVMLVSRPAVQVVERIVEVPVEQPGSDMRTAHDDQSPGEANPPPRPDYREIESHSAPSRSAAALASWLAASDWAGHLSKESYPALRNAVLAGGLPSLPRSPAAATGGSRRDDVPASYRQWRESLLENQPAEKPSANRPARGILLFSGASS